MLGNRFFFYFLKNPLLKMSLPLSLRNPFETISQRTQPIKPPYHPKNQRTKTPEKKTRHATSPYHRNLPQPRSRATKNPTKFTPKRALADKCTRTPTIVLLHPLSNDLALHTVTHASLRNVKSHPRVRPIYLSPPYPKVRLPNSNESPHSRAYFILHERQLYPEPRVYPFFPLSAQSFSRGRLMLTKCVAQLSLSLFLPRRRKLNISLREFKPYEWRRKRELLFAARGVFGELLFPRARGNIQISAGN